jgi:cytochrome b involved in lipid metabolism
MRIDLRLGIAACIAVVVIALAFTLPKDAAATQTTSSADQTTAADTTPIPLTDETWDDDVLWLEDFDTWLDEQASTAAEPTVPASTPVVSEPTPAKTSPYSREAIATHASADDCWIIVRGQVYDVTEYIPIHPGGERRITNVCGSDATSPFETQGGSGSHSSKAWKILARYALGNVTA